MRVMVSDQYQNLFLFGDIVTGNLRFGGAERSPAHAETGPTGRGIVTGEAAVPAVPHAKTRAIDVKTPLSPVWQILAALSRTDGESRTELLDEAHTQLDSITSNGVVHGPDARANGDDLRALAAIQAATQFSRSSGNGKARE